MAILYSPAENQTWHLKFGQFLSPPGGIFCALRISQGQHSTACDSKLFPVKKNSAWNQNYLGVQWSILTYQTVICPTTVWLRFSSSCPVLIWIREISAVAIFSSLNCRESWGRFLWVIISCFVVSFFVFLFWVRSFWLWVWEIDENDLRKRVRGAVPVSFSQALALIGSSRSIRTYGKLGPDDWLGTTYDTLRNGQGR